MAVYRYKAIGASGTVEGLITADTPAEGRMRLRRDGLQVLQFHAPETKRGGGQVVFSRRPGEAAVNEATHYLAMLLKAGVPLSEALGVVARQVPRPIEVVLRRVSEKLSEGTEFSEALEAEPRTFDPVFVGVVRVGQAAGTLDQSLERLVSLRQRRQQLRQRVTAAMTYPLIVVLIGAAVVFFLLTYVVPKITGLLTETGRSIPLPTQLLMSLSELLQGPGGLLLLGLAGAVCLAPIFDRRGVLKAWGQRAALKLPVIGEVVMKAGVAQMAAMLEAMLKSGLPLDESLELTSRSIQNPVIRRELLQMREALRQGQPLASLKDQPTALPPVVMHVLAVGEQTGQLEDMLGELARSYDEGVDAAARQAVSVLEPALIVVISVVVGFIVLATILPIIRLSGSV